MKVSRDVRDAVLRRAGGACEYCRLPPEASVLPHHVDHIIGRQHQGSDDLDNLCLSCIRCNQKKGPNIASIDPEAHLIVPLFHPRHHPWPEHFSLDDERGTLHGLTSQGRATVQLLAMNDTARVNMRLLLLRRGWFP